MSQYIDSELPNLPTHPIEEAVKPEDLSQIRPCCVKIIDTLAHINTMMVCSDCKHIIKTFGEEKAFKNYLRFCSGRSRVIKVGYYKARWIVVYNSFTS